MWSKDNFKLNTLILFGLTFLIFLPNLRIFFKYTPYPVLLSIVYFLFLVTLFKIIFSRSNFINSLISNKILLFIILLSLYTLTYIVYPIADGLKVQMRGSDQDDCVILGVKHLLNLENPYLTKSYFGNPCSTGFGVLLFYIPFVYFDMYALGAPFITSVLTYFIYKYYNDLSSAGIFLIVNIACLLMVELMVVGSDLILIGMGIVLLALLLSLAIEKENIRLIILVAIICGIIASTRINFMILIFISASYIFLYHKKGAWVFLVISLTLALGPSVIIYLSNPDMFTPLHLIGKSKKLLPPMLRYVIVFMTGILYFYSLFIVNRSAKNIAMSFFIVLFPMLIGLSLSDLVFLRDLKFQYWEGANYLIPLIPLSSLLVVEFRRSYIAH